MECVHNAEMELTENDDATEKRKAKSTNECKGRTLQTLDHTIRIGSTPTFLYFDLYLYSAYAGHYVYFNECKIVSVVKNSQPIHPFFNGDSDCDVMKATSSLPALDSKVLT